MPISIYDAQLRMSNDSQPEPGPSSEQTDDLLKHPWANNWNGGELSVAQEPSSKEIMEADKFFDYDLYAAPKLAEAPAPRRLPTHWAFRPHLLSMPLPPPAALQVPYGFVDPTMSLPPLPDTHAPPEPVGEVQIGLKRAREEIHEAGPSRPTSRPKTAGRPRGSGSAKEGRRTTYTCGWRNEDDTLCDWRGSSDAVFQHVRTAHGLWTRALPEPVPVAINCNWGPCAHTSLPGDMHAHWRTDHKPHIAEDVTIDDDGKETVTCRACPEGEPDAVMQRGNLLKHLRLKHWRDGRWCDHCGRRVRADTFDQAARDHRGACLLKLMNGPHFRR
ncbi:uncharacterized protein B0H18DRAFT_961515 [Fomitopsis serialis]|uniref:uncharacterized protein n=1 Tax=Fomitopsis serialis TaxID=139415 RepID=UPI00200759FB|nr:uncharacterized protein B0H18DRAFT_961515 [Neoantrodia serialis]KAH9911972.1 hypothetical protein B0H18DRAFT_961515 [Neoantrodia serialis]